MREQNKSIQDMLTAFIADGGQVIMCAACSAAAGLTQETISTVSDGVMAGGRGTAVQPGRGNSELVKT